MEIYFANNYMITCVKYKIRRLLLKYPIDLFVHNVYALSGHPLIIAAWPLVHSPLFSLCCSTKQNKGQ